MCEMISVVITGVRQVYVWVWVCCVLCAVCCVGVLCAVCCVLCGCAVCCVLCAVCCVLCAVCCVLCAVCCVLCAVCCEGDWGAPLTILCPNHPQVRPEPHLVPQYLHHLLNAQAIQGRDHKNSVWTGQASLAQPGAAAAAAAATSSSSSSTNQHR
jgi:hypothetical protein